MPYFGCDQCPKGYSRPSLLEQHMRTHTGERPFKCDQCDAAFTRKSHRDSHARIHNDTKAITCPECGKGFHTKQHFTRHQGMHMKNFKCDECGEGFRMKIQLDRHILRHSLNCPGCHENFRTPKLLERHVQDKRVHKCHGCGHIAPCYNALQTHIQEHANEPPKPKKPEGPPARLPLPPSEPAIKGEIDPHLFDPLQKRPRKTTKTTIGLVTGSHNKHRSLPCPMAECEHRSFRKYDLARHIASVHPEIVEQDLEDDEGDSGSDVEVGEVEVELAENDVGDLRHTGELRHAGEVDEHSEARADQNQDVQEIAQIQQEVE